MGSDKKSYSNDPRLGRTLREDFRQVDFISEIKKEVRELKNFYIDEHKKERLQNMNTFSGFFHVVIWLIKSLFLRLTPFRRILTVAGVVLFIFGRIKIGGDGGNVVIIDNAMLGGILILFVLMLELKDKLLAKDELEAGRKVQRALLPDENPKVEGWSAWLYTRPANEVGGDLVDYIEMKDKRVGLTMADVAGKGLSAALMMSKLQATIRSLATEYDSLSKFASKINEIFNRDSLPNLFASMLYMEIIPNSGKLIYVNSGHLPPIVIKEDEVQQLMKGEAALGLLKNANFTEHHLNLKPGEIFIVYSDGVTEACNSYNELFGIERLISTVKKYKNVPPDQLGERIKQQVDAFIGEAPASDDLSLIILKKS